MSFLSKEDMGEEFFYICILKRTFHCLRIIGLSEIGFIKVVAFGSRRAFL